MPYLQKIIGEWLCRGASAIDAVGNIICDISELPDIVGCILMYSSGAASSSTAIGSSIAVPSAGLDVDPPDSSPLCKLLPSARFWSHLMQPSDAQVWLEEHWQHCFAFHLHSDCYFRRIFHGSDYHWTYFQQFWDLNSLTRLKQLTASSPRLHEPIRIVGKCIRD